MRVEIKNQLYESYEQVLDTNHECPIDTEYNLPDYCADIQKILKCVVTPEVTAAAVIGDSVSVDGTADIRVLYLDAKGECVRGFDMKKEFSFTLRLNGNVEGAIAFAKPSVQHLTCRAMNARRVDIHIALGFHVSVSGMKREAVTECVQHDWIETRSERYAVSAAAGCSMQTFILEENIDLQNGKPPVETLLRRSVRYCVDNTEVKSGEVLFSGRACVEVLYRTFADSALPERMLFELPFSQTVECAQAEELCTASVCFVGGECSIQPREDSVGEYTILNIYLKPTFQIKLSKPAEVCSVCDAFSIQGALAAKFNEVSMERVEKKPVRSIRLRETLRIPEGDLERVLDIWCDGVTLSAFTEKETYVIRGKCSICVLYQNKEKRIAFFERMLDFTDTGLAPVEGRYSAEGEVTAVRFAISDASSLECTLEMQVTEQMRTVYRVHTLAYAELDEDVTEDDCCAAVYYASAGENIWDIAKHYCARVESIRKHNGCTAETVSENRPLIICRR